MRNPAANGHILRNRQRGIDVHSNQGDGEADEGENTVLIVPKDVSQILILRCYLESGGAAAVLKT